MPRQRKKKRAREKQVAKRTNGKGLTSAQQSASEKRAVKQTGSAMKLSAAVKEGGKRRAATSPPSNKTVNKKRPRTEPASDARSAIKHLREEEFEFEESGDEIEMDGSFHFDVGDSATKSWDLTSVREMYRKSGASGSSSVQQKIDAVKEDMSDSEEEEEEEEEFDEKNETSDNGESDDNNDQQPDTTRTLREAAKPVNRSKQLASSSITFSDLHISRPILKAIGNIGWSNPTPIQQKCIPIGMAGKDIMAQAVTGSGKTAAFTLPFLERLLFRPRNLPAIRVVILSPTRELAAQTFANIEQLCVHTDIKVSLAVGGLSVKVQEAQLRQRPDIVVATPGRLIDLVRNSRDVMLDGMEVLVMDEADRLLDMGFKDEIEEIVRLCPKQRQTLLFSATLTKDVRHLAAKSLNCPVSVKTNADYSMASGLIQEFIRVRKEHEEFKPAMLVALCKRVFARRCIIFLSTKRLAHRMRIIFGLLGLHAAELHGNLSQQLRLEALENFRDEKVSFLLATDLASRGLDIVGIETVINYDMPKVIQPYIHRVGRTARAGASGKSVSFVCEGDRRLMREIVKGETAESLKSMIRQRTIPRAVIEKYATRIRSLAGKISEIAKREREEKEIRLAEMEANRAHNMIEHSEEISSRPARTWFQSQKEKRQIKALSK